MKKLNFLLIAAFLFFTNYKAILAAPTDSSTNVSLERKGYIGVSGGVAFAYSNFGSKNPNNQLAGIANSGGHFNVSFGYRIGKKFGIAGLLLAQQNSMDKNTVAILLNNEAQYYNLEVKNISVTKWQTAGLLAGGYYVADSKVAFTMRLLVGYLASKSPTISYKLVDPKSNRDVNSVQQEGNGGAIAAIFGVGIKTGLSENICFIGNFDFLNTKPEFSNIGIYGNGSLLGVETFSQEISTINLSVGIGFKLK